MPLVEKVSRNFDALNFRKKSNTEGDTEPSGVPCDAITSQLVPP